MTIPLSELPAWLAQVARGVGPAVDGIVKAGATAAVKRVVETTPADTGQARSNWITTLDTPVSLTIAPYAPGTKLGLGETANAAAAIAQGDAAVKGFSTSRNVSVIVQNNVPYIEGLNDGTISRQSSNMIEHGAQAAELAIVAELEKQLV